MANPFTPFVSDLGDSVVKPVEGPATAPAQNVFTKITPERVGDLAVTSANAADRLNAETPAYIASKVAAAKTQDARNQERLGTIQQETNVFTSHLASIDAQQKEVDAQKLDVANRADKVSKLNPILRPFIQLFHPSLSDEEIQTDAMAAEMRGRALSDQFLHTNQNYSGMLQAHQNLWGAEDAADKSGQAVVDTTFNGLITTVEMADRNLNASAAGYDKIANARSNEYQMGSIALASLTDAQVSAAEQKARASGLDYVDINGAKVPLGMIEHTRQQDQQSAMSRQASALALQSNQVALADHMRDRSIKEMSMPALISAVKAGGNGLPMTELQQELTNRAITAQTAGQVIDSAESGAARVAAVAKQYDQQGSQLVRNYGFMNGTGNITNIATQGAITNYMRVKNDTHAALAREAGSMTPAREAALTRNVQTAYDSMVSAFSKDVEAQGGSKEMAAAKRTFIVSGQLDPNTAGQVITQGIMGGQSPDQLRLRGDAAAAYAAGQRKYESLVAPALGMTPESMKGKSKEQMQALMMQAMNSGKIKKPEIERQVLEATRAAYSVAAGQKMHLNVPDLLKQAGVDTGVSNDAWVESVHAGEAMVTQALQKNYGLNKDQAADVVTRGENSAFYSDAMARAGITRAKMAGASTSATMQYLDANYADGSHIPSAAIAAGMMTPQFSRLAGNLQPAMANRDFGNFVINSFVGDNIASSVDGMRQGYVKAAKDRIASIKGSWNRGVGLYGNNPQVRFDAVLHNTDLTTADVKAISDEMQRHLTVNVGMGSPAEMRNARPDYSRAFDVMGSTKFENPRLEALRKQVVKQLPKVIEQTDRVMAIRGSVNPVILGEEK